MKILYAEDERRLSMAVAEILRINEYDVDCVYDGAEALKHLRSGCYDAAILDIMMPVMDGIEVLKAMRMESDYTPVLMLTAKASTDDRIEGLTTGADDYLGKPFNMKELLAHLTSLLRRSNAYRDKLISFGNVTLNCETGEVKTEKGSLRLSGRESALLALFIKHPGVVLDAARISDTAGVSLDDPAAVKLYISYLKNKLGQIKADITIAPSGGGYTLQV